MDDHGYGLWFLVVVNTAVVLPFAASFFHKSTGASGQTGRGDRAMTTLTVQSADHEHQAG